MTNVFENLRGKAAPPATISSFGCPEMLPYDGCAAFATLIEDRIEKGQPCPGTQPSTNWKRSPGW